MAKSKKEKQVTDYRYDEKRKNNPPAGLAEYEKKVKEPQVKKYAYDPHLSPQLVWAGKPGLKAIEVEDKAGVEVETVSLHVHERVSTKAIINAVRRQDKQGDLFADPKLPFHESVKFYEHDVDWSNRLILGDSLLVANSLLEREMLAGTVQMIYMDPPYGVKYASNFQARIDSRDVKEKDHHITREPEMIKAYRDTWKLGIHSYLTYMRDRLRVCWELLSESGSIFLQISDENLHIVRNLMDEVFGPKNFVSLITFRKKTGPLGSQLLPQVSDYLLWYSKNISSVKFRRTYRFRDVEGDNIWSFIKLPDGIRRRMTSDENMKHSLLPKDASIFRRRALSPAGFNASATFEVLFEGEYYSPPKRTGGASWATNKDGIRRLIESRRVIPTNKTLDYVYYLEDFPYTEMMNVWAETRGETDKIYVVQTDTSILARCFLMTTDPGDLVFDPTCGSGTTAYVAEQWGRRWITCDTSRVALSIARQRLLTATFPYYQIDDDAGGQNPGYGFKYKTVPHVTLKSIAQNTRIDSVAEKVNPLIQKALAEFNKAVGTDLKEWQVPFEPDKKWPQATQKQFSEFRRLKREKQQKIDAIIAEDAPQETLYDQPAIDSKTTRVSGPFTVEAIPPPVVEAESPISGAPEELDSFETSTGLSEGNHIPSLIDLLQKDGVTFPGNRRMKFDVLTARTGGVLHAEGEAEGRRVAVSFGPLHGPVSIIQVQDALREAYLGGYDDVIFCGFAFDPEAHATIRENPHPKIKAHASHIRPDILLTDSEGKSLLKTTASSQLFTVFGEPDIELIKKEQSYTIQLHGVDIYDPVDGVVHSENANRVAAWFVDTDYDGQTFCIVQAFFPDKSAWKKIERALKGTLAEERFELLTGQVSLPFKAGEHKRAAVKVIDPRGNEVMKVIRLSEKAEY